MWARCTPKRESGKVHRRQTSDNPLNTQWKANTSPFLFSSGSRKQKHCIGLNNYAVKCYRGWFSCAVLINCWTVTLAYFSFTSPARWSREQIFPFVPKCPWELLKQSLCMWEGSLTPFHTGLKGSHSWAPLKSLVTWMGAMACDQLDYII